MIYVVVVFALIICVVFLYFYSKSRRSLRPYTPEDKVIKSELGKKAGPMAAAGGALGGGLAGGIGAAYGAREGRKIAHNVFGDDVKTITLTTSKDSAEILKQATDTLKSLGKLTGDVDANHSSVSGVIGMGLFKMNPAVVTVSIEGQAQGKNTVAVRGTAQEYLIKYHSGEKAAKKVADLLSSKL